MSVTDAAAMLAVGEDAVKRYLLRGQLEGFRLPGGHYRVYVDSVDRLMKGKVGIHVED